MKFLVDAQLPKKLFDYLIRKGYDSIHTLDLPNKNSTSDNSINELSISEERILITKDADFYNSYLQKSEPYKLIFLTTGNISTLRLLAIFEKNHERIFEEISFNTVVEVTSSSIITII